MALGHVDQAAVDLRILELEEIEDDGDEDRDLSLVDVDGVRKDVYDEVRVHHRRKSRQVLLGQVPELSCPVLDASDAVAVEHPLQVEFQQSFDFVWTCWLHSGAYLEGITCLSFASTVEGTGRQVNWSN